MNEENLEYGVDLLEEAEAILKQKFGEAFVEMNPQMIVQFSQTLVLDRVSDTVSFLLSEPEEDNELEEEELA